MKFRSILALLLLGAMVFSLCACGAANGGDETTKAETTEKADIKDTEETTAPAAKTFAVTVKDAEGNTVPGVVVQICKDSCIPARTDDNGVATFNIEIEDGHKLSVMSCPEGYEYTGEAEIYLDSGITEYTLEISKVN